MRTEKSRLMVFATVAAIIGVTSSLVSSAILSQTTSSSWLIFSMLAVGASLSAAYITLLASQRQSLKESKAKRRVFLSFARGDEERAESLYRKLQAEGFQPWMDIKSLSPGENWIRGIERAIEESDFLVALISKNSLDQRGFLQREMKLVLDLPSRKSIRKVHIIPARLDNSIVPEPLTKFHWVDLFEESGFSKLLGTLQLRSEEVGEDSAA